MLFSLSISVAVVVWLLGVVAAAVVVVGIAVYNNNKNYVKFKNSQLFFVKSDKFKFFFKDLPVVAEAGGGRY